MVIVKPGKGSGLHLSALRVSRLLATTALFVGVVATFVGSSAAATRTSSLTRHARAVNGTLSTSEAKKVLASFSAALKAANVAANPAKISQLETGAAAADVDAQYRLARAYGGSYLNGLRGASTAFTDPRFAIATAKGYPRYFAVTAGGALFPSKERGALLFQQLKAGEKWKLVDIAPLGLGQHLPALDTKLAAPLTGPTAALRNGGSALTNIVDGVLTESMNPASSAVCPGPVSGSERYDVLTGMFTTVVSAERKDCTSLHASNIGLAFYWDTTPWSVVSLPTASGGAISFLSLTQHAVESPPSGSQSLSCPPNPNPCDVYLSSRGHYPVLNLDYLYQFVIVTKKFQKHRQSLDLIGLTNQVVDVTDAQP